MSSRRGIILALALALVLPSGVLASSQAPGEYSPAASAAAEGRAQPAASLQASGPIQTPSEVLSPLAQRLGQDPRALQYGPDGRLEAVFGVSLAEARIVFYPVSRSRALPEGYEPPDLVTDLGHPLRALVVGEFDAMFAAAARDGAYPEVISGYRSAAYQAMVFERAVQRQLLRGEPISREEAEDRAAHFVAPPGHSQHQLGTTADLSSWEMSYGIGARFAETDAGRWLAEHAWEYGFILPYTAAAEPRTGYIAESWHVRWVGRPLASLLWEGRYLLSSYPAADDWLLALEELVSAHGGPPTGAEGTRLLEEEAACRQSEGVARVGI